MEISLEDLQIYARCPLEWFWEKRAGYARPRSTNDLMSNAFRAALKMFYRGEGRTFGEALATVWKGWCAEWGEPTLSAKLAQYATTRASLLNQVERLPGDTLQTLKWKQAYKSKMRVSGLHTAGQALDEVARSHGLALPDVKDRVGSALGDAFAESLAAVDYLSAARFPLPDRARVVGWQVPFRVELGHNLRLSGVADLMWKAESDDTAVVVEVHDYHPLAWVRARLVRHDVRVIAATLAQPVSTGDAIQWARVTGVLFRHWPSGTTLMCNPEGNVGPLHALLTSTLRGMQNHIFIPRSFSGYDSCRSCVHLSRCWDDGPIPIHFVDYGLIGPLESGDASAK